MNEIQGIINTRQCCNCANLHPNIAVYPVVNPTVNKKIEPETITNHFVSEYYRGVSNIGWNHVLYLFDQKCSVLFKDKIVGNSHDLLNYLSSEYVKRANYGELRPKWIVIAPDTLVINVFGLIQLVSFAEYCGYAFPFTETFVLKIDNKDNIKCVQHILDM